MLDNTVEEMYHIHPVSLAKTHYAKVRVRDKILYYVNTELVLEEDYKEHTALNEYKNMLTREIL